MNKKTLFIVFALSCAVSSFAKPTEAQKKMWNGMLQSVVSSFDGSPQPCYFWAPKDVAEPIPLIVGLHTWSYDYHNIESYDGAFQAAKSRGWAFVGPNFRGPNKTPSACGGEPAVQDIVDAVRMAQSKTKVDPNRIYIIGGSGGGHLTLLMLGRHPEIFAAGAAFCPITDTARWHADSLLKHPGRHAGYAKMLEGACGGTPQERPNEYALRSPLTWLSRAADAGVPAYIATGIHDGWKGSVPVGHAIRAYNALAAEEDRIGEDRITYIEENRSVDPSWNEQVPDDPFYKKNQRIHLRRTSGNVRLTLFEGGHAGNFAAGVDFLSRQRKGQKVDWTLPASAASGSADAITK